MVKKSATLKMVKDTMKNISSVDPESLSEPRGMSELVVAKCHAVNQCKLIDEALKRLRALRRKWNTRLGACLRGMHKGATK